tara:strand:- start:1876 stop:2487 length:612 start_codon:yes stop_codon:yes gene_type:complete
MLIKKQFFYTVLNYKDIKLSNNSSFSVTSVNSYSLALYELAKENNSLDLVEQQVNSIIELIKQSEDFNILIKDPTNKQREKLNAMKTISEKFNFNEIFKKFLNFLIFKRRFNNIERILKDFLDICSNKRGEIRAKLTAAKELNNNDIEKIKNELAKNFGSNIKINYRHDPSLIGGLIVQIGSIMVDTSIKNKLQNIENKMIEL